MPSSFHTTRSRKLTGTSFKIQTAAPSVSGFSGGWKNLPKHLPPIPQGRSRVLWVAATPGEWMPGARFVPIRSGLSFMERRNLHRLNSFARGRKFTTCHRCWSITGWTCRPGANPAIFRSDTGGRYVQDFTCSFCFIPGLNLGGILPHRSHGRPGTGYSKTTGSQNHWRRH